MIPLRPRASLLSLLALLLLLTSGCAFGKAMKAGDEHLAAGRYSQALNAYEKALKLKPESMEAQAKVAQAQAGLFEESSRKATALLQGGDILGAIEVGSEVHRRLPPSAAKDELINGIAAGANARIDQEVGQGEYGVALVVIDAAAKGLPTWSAAMEGRRQQVVARWVEVLEGLGESARKAGRPGDALLCYAQIARLTGVPAHLARRDELRRQLDDELRYVIQPRGQVRDEGFMAVAPRLATRDPGPLLQVLGPREKGRAAVQLGFSLGRPTFQTYRSDDSKSVEYQSGTRQVANPSHESKQNEVTDQERRLNEAQDEVLTQTEYVEQYSEDVAREGPSPNTSTGAEQNLSNAKNRLEAARRKEKEERDRLQKLREELRDTPAFNEEPVYSVHTFPVATYTLRAEIRLQGDLTHGDGRPAQGFGDQLVTSASDETYPAQPVAGVAEDPLALPSQGELADRLWEQARLRIEAEVRRSFDEHRHAFLAQARAAKSEAEVIEALVAYVLLDPSSVEPEVGDWLYRLRRIGGVADLLARSR
ncbi:MAG: tetratricopeptide repeat protein [Deltaproteobacteria bacterium]|nr:tetratricopeptide repeat protein [Deltaproteobacteria bacterium]